MSTQRNTATPQPAKKAGNGHKVAAGVIIGTVILVVAALFTAFVWPGWANRLMPGAVQETSQTTSSKTKKKAGTAAPVPLAADATTLLKAMPDQVGSFARQTVSDTSEWKDASPIEEHSITYSTGDNDDGNVTLLVAQWSNGDDAEKQYQSVLSTLKGKKLAAGAVKVSGQQTGSYELHDTSNADQVVALWRNDTCLFRVTGPTDAVEDFYKGFPL
jgi:hypothetical protein